MSLQANGQQSLLYQPCHASQTSGEAPTQGSAAGNVNLSRPTCLKGILRHLIVVYSWIKTTHYRCGRSCTHEIGINYSCYTRKSRLAMLPIKRRIFDCTLIVAPGCQTTWVCMLIQEVS